MSTEKNNLDMGEAREDTAIEAEACSIKIS
jgi:hypothetical protein